MDKTPLLSFFGLTPSPATVSADLPPPLPQQPLSAVALTPPSFAPSRDHLVRYERNPDEPRVPPPSTSSQPTGPIETWPDRDHLFSVVPDPDIG